MNFDPEGEQELLIVPLVESKEGLEQEVSKTSAAHHCLRLHEFDKIIISRVFKKFHSYPGTSLYTELKQTKIILNGNPREFISMTDHQQIGILTNATPYDKCCLANILESREVNEWVMDKAGSGPRAAS